MAVNEPFNVWIGWDSREQSAAHVCKRSIETRTKSVVNIKFLKHRELRDKNLFKRPWLIEPDKGNFIDLMDGKPFSTEFSHTRFLVPNLMNYNGWALFQDSDMMWLSDIKNLFAMADDRYAVMCVKHNHAVPQEYLKMDSRLQTKYFRKNWSSFVLWNCSHRKNKFLTTERVNTMKGSDMHAFSWLSDDEIGGLPFTYNFIPGISNIPTIDGKKDNPECVHYTDGGPWFDNYKDVPYAKEWMREYTAWREETEEAI